jgi:proteic killer suppression protein
MQLEFATADLRVMCEDSRCAQRTIGAGSARRLQARLADLLAASTLGDVKAGRPHPLRGDREGQYALSLSGGCRLVLIPIDDPIPRIGDGSVSWANVTAARIVFIGD